MQEDILKLPPRTFFKPSSFNGGSQKSVYRSSPNNHFFNAFKNGFQNGQKSLFSNDDEKSLENSHENIRRRSPGEWNEGFYSEQNRAVENPYALRNSPPRFGLRRISPTQADTIQDQQEIQVEAERYAAIGARPHVRSGEQHGQPHLQYPIVSPMDQKLLSSNRKRGYKDSKKLFVFLWLLIFVFIALGGLSIGLGLYYGLPQTPPNQVNVDFTVVNATFDASLNDKSSSNYSNWKTRIFDACTNLLKNQDSKDSLIQSCSDISFKPGSIKVSLNLVVSPGLNKSEIIRRLNGSFPDRFLPGYECMFERESTRSEGSTITPQVSFTTKLPPAVKETISINQTSTIHSDSPSLPSTTYHVTPKETHYTSITALTTSSTTPTTTKDH